MFFGSIISSFDFFISSFCFVLYSGDFDTFYGEVIDGSSSLITVTLFFASGVLGASSPKSVFN